MTELREPVHRGTAAALCKTPVVLKAVEGGFVPADKASRKVLSSAHVKVGDNVLAMLDAPRNPGFHRLAYKFARVCRHNIDDFAGLSEHDVLKQLQLRTGMGCEQVEIPVGDVWGAISETLISLVGPQALAITAAVEPYMEGETVQVNRPRSLSFGDMSQSEFRLMFSAFCRYVSETYWPTLTDVEVAQLAALMPDEAP